VKESDRKKLPFDRQDFNYSNEFLAKDKFHSAMRRLVEFATEVDRKQKEVSFDPKCFLRQWVVARTITQCPKDYKIFSQGDPAPRVFSIFSKAG